MTELTEAAKQMARNEADAAQKLGRVDGYRIALAIRCQAELDARDKPGPDGVVTEWHREQFPEVPKLHIGTTKLVWLADAATVLAKYVRAPEPERDPDLDRAKAWAANYFPASEGFGEEIFGRDDIERTYAAALKEGRNGA